MSRFNRAEGRIRRHIRLRKKIRGTESRPRLAVFKSNTNIYAQVINDKTGETIVSASYLEKEFRAKFGGKLNVETAKTIGEAVAKRAKAKGVTAVVFDRGGFIIYSRIKEIKESGDQYGI